VPNVRCLGLIFASNRRLYRLSKWLQFKIQACALCISPGWSYIIWILISGYNKTLCLFRGWELTALCFKRLLFPACKFCVSVLNTSFAIIMLPWVLLIKSPLFVSLCHCVKRFFIHPGMTPTMSFTGSYRDLKTQDTVFVRGPTT